MPRQSLSLRPQHLVLSGEERVQNEFIKALGPYFARATFEDQGREFLARTFNIWFSRWPLKLSDFEDTDFMRHRRQSIEKVGHNVYILTIHPRLSTIFIRIFPAVYGGLVLPKRSRSIPGSDTWPSARPDMEFVPI
jgi:hypothetical protein